MDDEREEWQKCEICEKSALHMAQDLVEFDNMMTSYKEFFRDGPKHFFCDEHNRESRTRFGGVIFTKEEYERVREQFSS